MLDMSQDAPPAYEQVLTRNLLQCGLRSGGFTVRYEKMLQSVEIVIANEAGARAEHFDCIRYAAGYEIVTFKDPGLQQAYEDRMSGAMRPKMLGDARAELERRGVLNGFPKRSDFGSDKLFAEALERQCGMAAGSFFVQGEAGLVGRPKPGRLSKVEEEQMSCLAAAIMYVAAKGENFRFGFLGNEVTVPDR